MSQGQPVTNGARKAFLEALRETANVSESARRVGLARKTVYQIRNEDSDFAAAWDDAIDEAIDGLEREAWRRAKEGVDKPVFYQGEECGYMKEYSDRLMELLLKAHRPEKYKDRVENQMTGKDGKEFPELNIIVQGPGA